MTEWIRNLVAYREVLYMITWRDIRVKYKQSVMGFLWAIFMPAVIVSAGVVVRLIFAKLSGREFNGSQILTVSVKAVPWSFFVASVRFATNSLTANHNLLTKIYLPSEIFPISAVLSQLFDFAVASLALTVVFAVLGVGWSIHILWVPMIIGALIVLVSGLGLLFSAANLFFRDVKYVVEVILTFAIFFTPVFYEAEVAGRWKTVLLLNPVAPILEALNDSVVLQIQPDLPWLMYSTAMALVTFVAALAFFRRLQPLFAESI